MEPLEAKVSREELLQTISSWDPSTHLTDAIKLNFQMTESDALALKIALAEFISPILNTLPDREFYPFIDQLAAIQFKAVKISRQSPPVKTYIHKLRHLEYLNLKGTYLQNSDINYLSFLKRLKGLNLSGSDGIADLTPLAQNGKTLTCLNLKNCSQISENSFLDLFGMAPNIADLNVVGCRNITERVFTAISTYLNLKRLHIEQGHVKADTVVPWAAKNTQLTALSLCNFTLQNDFFSLVGTRLQSLSLPSCQYREKNFDHLTNLGHLSLTQPEIPLSALTNLTSLKSLNLKTLPKLTALVKLSLPYSEISEIPYTSLTSLNLENGSKVTDKTLDSIAKNTSLTSLNLSCCINITYKGVMRLQEKCTRLKKLNLKGTGIK